MKPIKALSLCFPNQNRNVASLALTLLALPYWGCGGSSSSSSSPSTPTAVATPPPCAQSVVFQGSGEIPASTLGGVPITVASAGRLDLTIDWTFSTNPMGLYLVQGSCSLDQFNTRTCNFLTRIETAAKPLKGSVSVQAGSYTVLLANYGSRDDSGALQVVLSTGSCPAASSAASSGWGDTVRQVRRSQAFHR